MTLPNIFNTFYKDSGVSFMSMVHLSLNKVRPGMKLAEDIYTNNGTMVLCKRNTVLTENIIQRLEDMGIEKIAVEQSMPEKEIETLLGEKLELIDKAFEDKKGDCIKTLKKAFALFWKRKLGSNE